MRPDHYIGAVIALGLFSGLATISRNPAVHSVTAALKKTISEPPFIEIKEPEILDERPPGDVAEKTRAEPDLSPPKLPDTIAPLTDTAFVTPVQPPVPDGAKIVPGLVTIPKPGSNGEHGSGKIFDPSSLDQQPAAKFQGKPVYPYDMKRNGTSGEVVVDFIVDPNGDVRNAYAVSSSQREFESAAVQAVSKWKFRPGRKANGAVSTHMQVPIVFRLGEE